ncbi:MAG: IS3 family transposase, partial [Prevotella sp.]
SIAMCHIHFQFQSRQQSLSGFGMSRKGNCLDNSVMENFFGIMKSELLYANKYTSVESFITDLKEYMVYYNNERIKLRLNGMSPVLYRKAFEKTHSI